MRDNEMGAFLRARREAVSPATVGLPDGTRRRTPGLRRGELATIAGISVEYLTRLEQGRDRRPSTEILAALADALHLTSDERIHLYRLTKTVTGNTCHGGAPLAAPRATVLALLECLEPTPAVLTNPPGDLLAHNTGYRRLTEPTGLLDDETPNLARFVFTDPRATDVFPAWDRIADERAADLWAAASLGDVPSARLAEELSISAGTRFSTRFRSPAALPARTGTHQWAHPTAGTLTLTYETLEIAESDEQRLLVYLPADEDTTTAITRLTRP